MAAECVAFKSWVFSELKRIHPTMVVSSFSRNDRQLKDRATGAAADDEWTKQITATGQQVLADAGSYVLLAPPQLAASEPGVCITKFSHPADCATPLSADYTHQVGVEARAIAAVGGTRAKFVDTTDWFCADGECPAFADGILIRADKLHLTAAASTALAPFLRDALLGSHGGR